MSEEVTLARAEAATQQQASWPGRGPLLIHPVEHRGEPVFRVWLPRSEHSDRVPARHA